MDVSERGRPLHDVSLSAWLFNTLVHPRELGQPDSLFRLYGNVCETAMTMTVKFSRADHRFECFAPLAIDHHTGLL